jgi:Flp pilus assembly protein TadB
MTAIPEKPAKTVSASVSNVGEPLSVDQSSRARKYFISMMVRTACFILAVVLPSPYRWIALFGAVVLPYVAVVVANAGRESIRGQATIISPGPREIGNK